MAVVAIGQQIGSNGLGLGKLVAAQLQYPLLTSEEIAAQVAREYYVTAEQLALVDEREPRFWERVCGEIQTQAAAGVSKRPLQCFRQRYESRFAIGWTGAPPR